MPQPGSRGRGALLRQDRVAFDRTPARVSAGPLPPSCRPPAEPGGEPDVQLVRAPDGTVIQITVRCPCGRQTTLRCEYSDQGESEPDEPQIA